MLVVPSLMMGQTYNPTLTTYLSGLATVMQQVRAAVAGMPQRRITMGAQHIPANANWTDVAMATCNPASNGGNACTWNNARVYNSYTDALASKGFQIVTFNWDMEPFVAASQYTGSLTASNWDVATLANYDSLVSHAVSKGLQIRLNPEPTSNLDTECGLDASSTEAALESCYLPLFAAMAARYSASIAGVAIIHEPSGAGTWGSRLPMSFTVSICHQFLVHVAAAIKAQQPSIECGAGAQTMTAGEAKYWDDWTGQPPASAPIALDFLGLDVFPSSWDVSQYLSTALTTAQNYASLALSAGLPLRIDATSRPNWVPNTAPNGGEGYSYEGNGDIAWAAGADSEWIDAMVLWAGAMGFQSLDTYASPITIWYTSDTANDSLTRSDSNFAKVLLDNLSGITPTGQTYARLAAGWAASLQGRAKLTGRARIGN